MKQILLQCITMFSIVLLSSCSVSNGSAKTFSSPEAAVDELEQVVLSRDKEDARELFGKEGDYILQSGDKVLDSARADKFVKIFNEAHRLEKQQDGSYVVLLGKKDWPFPVPLKQVGDSWQFDAEAGREEILVRNIGRNELSAVEVCREIIASQRQYAAGDADGDGVRKYATQIISSPGKRDGLYWPVANGEAVSPLGPVIAKAADENYSISPNGTPQPYHGYYYRLFTEAPAKAKAVDNFSKPGKFVVVSFPSSWGVSGIMSFAANERGWIYEKNLGADFKLVGNEVLAIDESWTRVE